MPKRSIREQMLRDRRHCSLELCLLRSRQIQERFLAGDSYRRARCLGLYSPLLNEVQTEQVARQAWVDGKHVVYPRVSGATLEFRAVSAFAQLAPGVFGVLEPVTPDVVPLAAIDLLVLPGVAFDLAGYRLGYGKGYYDRALSGCHAGLERVGFAYEFQVVAQLPAAAHDCRISWLVTEQRTLSFPA